MKLLTYIKVFTQDEDGAVTVDWVVLTAALVGIAVALVSTIGGGLETAATSISTSLTGAIT